MELISTHIPLIEKRKENECSRKSKYSIQNEVLECLSDMVREVIIKGVKESKFFSPLLQMKQRTLSHSHEYGGTIAREEFTASF